MLTKKLESCCSIYDVRFKKPISDSKTRWNSTYDMLQVAYDLKDSLNMLVAKNDILINFTISDEEWRLVVQLLDFLKDFKKVSEKISGEKYVTLPMAVIAFNCLLDKIEKKSFELDRKEDRKEVDEKLIFAFQKGRDKLLKHYNKCNWIYCVSLVLDPRIKAEGLDFTQWGREMKDETLNKFRSLYDNYYDKFNTHYREEEPAKKKYKKQEVDEIDFDVLFVKSQDTPVYGNNLKIKNYLESPRPTADVDILSWWKKHENTYPIISRMARDILYVQATSVPVERLFSEAALVLTKNRSALKDESL